jgi:hypothetical protein
MAIVEVMVAQHIPLTLDMVSGFLFVSTFIALIHWNVQ